MSNSSNQSKNVLPLTVFFDLKTGMSDAKETTKRHLSNMKGMFSDDVATDELVKNGNPLLYEFYEFNMPETAGDIQYGTSITYPGKVGNEYYMTKGHFHKILETAEVYYCLSGHGYMLMENPEGEWDAQELTPGKMLYVPTRWAHRTVNIGNEPLVTFFAFRGDAGHDYGTIESKGYRKLIVEIDGKVEIIDNPKWK